MKVAALLTIVADKESQGEEMTEYHMSQADFDELKDDAASLGIVYVSEVRPEIVGAGRLFGVEIYVEEDGGDANENRCRL